MKKFTLVVALSVSALMANFIATPAMSADNAAHNHQDGTATTTPGHADKTKPETPNAPRNKTAAASHDKTGMMDMDAMCDMHKEMMASGSKSERQMMMDERMKGMTAAEKKKHIKMMNEHCK
jgi:hypothetical protein